MMSDGKGNPVLNVIYYMFSHVSGALLGTVISRVFGLKRCITYSCIQASVALYVKKFVPISETTSQFMTFLVAFSLGFNGNQFSMINNSLIDFKYRFISYELNYCIGQTITMLAPLVAIQS